MRASVHILRNVIAAVLVLVGSALVAAAFDGALVTIVVLVELGLILAAMPIVVIHYDAHEERLRYRHPGQP